MVKSVRVPRRVTLFSENLSRRLFSLSPRVRGGISQERVTPARWKGKRKTSKRTRGEYQVGFTCSSAEMITEKGVRSKLAADAFHPGSFNRDYPGIIAPSEIVDEKKGPRYFRRWQTPRINGYVINCANRFHERVPTPREELVFLDGFETESQTVQNCASARWESRPDFCEKDEESRRTATIVGDQRSLVRTDTQRERPEKK